MAASERGTGTTDNGGASDAPNAPGALGASGARGGRLGGLGRSAGAGRSNRPAKDTRNTGPGRLLIAVYAIFALSATARAGYQILTKFSEAPLAYLLSAFAAVVYIVATISLAKPGPTWFKVSVTAVVVELVGVLVVGALSLFDAVNFPHETVWSLFGRGYGFIPLLLPILGLIWLYRRRPSARVAPSAD
ncbi:hypothetical protein ABC337_01945 [Arthrobacter sp. 1P04PC]|uniref:hypothetical protein n=1 Tax=Micrococcaceae TaxID=1268 RepID=UPI0039A16512